VTVLAFSPDGKELALGTRAGVVAVYPLQPTTVEDAPRTQKMHAGLVSSLAWAPDGTKVLSAGADGTVRVWDHRTLQPAQRFNAFPTSHPAAVWSPDGRRIAVAQGRDAIQLFSASDGQLVETFDSPGKTRALIWPSANDIIGGDDQGRVKFFQPGGRAPVRMFQPATPHRAVNSLSLYGAASLLAVGYDDGDVVLLERGSAKQVQDVPLTRNINVAAWSPNGQILAVSAEDFVVRFFDVQGRQGGSWSNGYDVDGLCWSADGHYLAGGVEDHTFKIWEVSPRQPPDRPVTTPPSYQGQ